MDVTLRPLTTNEADADGSIRGVVTTAIEHLLHAGKPPRRWVAATLALIALALAACGVMMWAGQARHGNAGTYFREGKIGTFLSVGALAAAGVVSILTARRLRDLPARQAARSFWLILGVFLLVLAIDDQFRLHESIDHAWHRATGLDPKHGPTAHLDNWIVASYGLVAAALFWRHRRYVATLGWFLRTMAVAFAGFAAMVYADTYIFHAEVEDSLKLVSGTLILCAFLAVYMENPALSEVPLQREGLGASH